MAENKRNFFLDMMMSGKPLDNRDEATMDTFVRYILLNSMIFLGGSLLVLFGLESIRNGAVLQGYFDLAMAFMTFVGFVVLRTDAPFAISGFLTVIPYLFLCAFLAHSGGVQGSGVLWMYSFPLLAIFLLGMRTGTILSLILLAGVAVSLFVPGVSPVTVHRSFALRTVGVYVLVLACTMIYEKTKVTKDRWVARLNRALQAERDEIAVMKDNLKDGLFLFDTDYLIQPQYSRALEGILSETDLSGRSFIDILGNSLQQKEKETLTDYFTMVFNRSYDAQMLEDINPLHRLSYFSVTTSEEKTLSCTFAPINRDDGRVYILGTVQDQTREVELQQQLSEEEGRRQDEMHALFEVIHVEPRVLNDFIEDAEYEFDRVNTILKDKEKSSQTVMVEIYQAVHAIKSNAVILGLDSFGTKLHALEAEIGRFAERLPGASGVGVLFRLTREAVQAGAIAGISSEEALRILIDATAKPLPDNVTHELRGWFGGVRRASAALRLVVTCPDEATAARIVEAARPDAERLGPLLVGLPPDRDPLVLARRLAKTGIALAVGLDEDEDEDG